MAAIKKEEILEKSRKNKLDEREVYIEEKAWSVGAWAVTLSIGFFMALRAFNGQKLDDLLAILLSYLAVDFFYKFSQYRKVLYLVGASIITLGALFFAVAYIIDIRR